MTREAADPHPTLALNTTLEKDFVTPLTSIRGALEILRDHLDMSAQERSRFLANALQDCSRLEKSFGQLASTVYAAGSRLAGESKQEKQTGGSFEHSGRIRFLPDSDIVEVDFSNFEFSSSVVVNAFYDELDRKIEASKRRWYVVVNYQHCSIWPEAWVAFAHRGKKVNISYSLGTVRYIDQHETDDGSAPTLMMSDPDLFASRELALARIEELRKSARGGAGFSS